MKGKLRRGVSLPSKMVESVTKVLKVCQRAFPRDLTTYMEISFIGVNCPKSRRRIMEQPPKGMYIRKGRIHVNRHQ